MDSKTYNILKELKDGKEAQTAAWLSHPDNYDDLVYAIQHAKDGQVGDYSIGETLEEGENAGYFPANFADANIPGSYPNYLAQVVADFSAQVSAYKYNEARERAVIYAPKKPIENTINPDNNERSMYACFYYCRWLVSIGEYDIVEDAASLAELNLVTDGRSVFSNCINLVTLPTKWTFNGLVNANSMFYLCKALTHLPDGFTGEHITNAHDLFNGCSSLVGLPSGFTLALANDANNLFNGCFSLEQIPNGFELGAVPVYSRMFYRCASLVGLPSSLQFDMSIVRNTQSAGEYSTDSANNSMYQMFQNMGAENIVNEFIITTGSQGIKFDLILWHNGFEKLSVASIVSLFDCLHDWWDDALEDYDYTDRFPNAAVAAATTTQQPTIYVTSAIFAQLTAAQKAIAADKGWDLQPYL